MAEGGVDRALLRWTAPIGLAGGVLALIGNFAHPTMPTEGEAALTIVAQNGAWTWIHLGIVLAGVLTMLSARGLVELADGAGRSPAKLGFLVSVLGASVLTVAMGIDGYLTKTLSDGWAAADAASRPTLLLIGHTVELLHTGLFYLWLPAFLGAPALLIGIGLLPTRRLLGGFGVLAGAACLIVGLWNYLTLQHAVEVSSLAASLASVIWYIASNIVALREARRT